MSFFALTNLSLLVLTAPNYSTLRECCTKAKKAEKGSRKEKQLQHEIWFVNRLPLRVRGSMTKDHKTQRKNVKRCKKLRYTLCHRVKSLVEILNMYCKMFVQRVIKEGAWGSLKIEKLIHGEAIVSPTNSMPLSVQVLD